MPIWDVEDIDSFYGDAIDDDDDGWGSPEEDMDEPIVEDDGDDAWDEDDDLDEI